MTALTFLRRFQPDPRMLVSDKVAAIHAALVRVIEAGRGLPLANLRVLLYHAVDWCDCNPQPRLLPRDYSRSPRPRSWSQTTLDKHHAIIIAGDASLLWFT